jgi:hypothetical protein
VVMHLGLGFFVSPSEVRRVVMHLSFFFSKLSEKGDHEFGVFLLPVKWVRRAIMNLGFFFSGWSEWEGRSCIWVFSSPGETQDFSKAWESTAKTNKQTNKQTKDCCIGDETQHKGWSLHIMNHDVEAERQQALSKRGLLAHGPPLLSLSHYPLIPDHWLPHSSILSTPPYHANSQCIFVTFLLLLLLLLLHINIKQTKFQSHQSYPFFSCVPQQNGCELGWWCHVKLQLSGNSQIRGKSA